MRSDREIEEDNKRQGEENTEREKQGKGPKQ